MPSSCPYGPALVLCLAARHVWYELEGLSNDNSMPALLEPILEMYQRDFKVTLPPSCLYFMNF